MENKIKINLITPKSLDLSLSLFKWLQQQNNTPPEKAFAALTVGINQLLDITHSVDAAIEVMTILANSWKKNHDSFQKEKI